MKFFRTIAVTSLVGLGAALAAAQPASGPGSGPRVAGPGAGAASGPGPGMRMGQGPGGPGAASGPAARWGTDYTPGWAMMTAKERDEHRERMRSAKTYEECKAAQQQHHDQMVARAKERGVAAPLARPRRDACAALKR